MGTQLCPLPPTGVCGFLSLCFAGFLLFILSFGFFCFFPQCLVILCWAKGSCTCRPLTQGCHLGDAGGGGEGGATALPKPQVAPPRKPQLAPHIPQAPRSNSSCFSIIPTEIQMHHHFNITFSYTLLVFVLFVLFFCD